MILIAFAGKATAGKSTAANVLVKHCGFTRISFAAPLYDMLAAGGFGRPTTQEEKATPIPGLGVTWRHAAQTLGTEWGRKHLGQDIWTRLALRKCVDPDGKYVIDDCRFENEAQTVREMGGTVVHIIGRQDSIAAEASAHVSEAGLVWKTEDYILDNSGSLMQLEDRIQNMLYAVVQG